MAGSGWGASVLGLSVVALTMAFRRWRHLLVFVCGLVLLNWVGTWIYFGLSRPRPYGVPIIGGWIGYAGVSPPVAVLTFCLMGIVYCLAVPGRVRSRTKAAVAAVVAVFSLARLYLGVDHPGDVLLGAAFAVAIAVTAFRYFTPNEVFPVVYRRGRAAHVDVTGRRGEAIRQAMRDQLGLEVTEIKPVGLESSAGSTPLRLRVEGGPDEFVFAKLYTKGRRPLVQAGADHPLRHSASPTQLRAFMKRDPRDLLGEFRALAPRRPPIILQRWSARRVTLAAATLAVTAAAAYVTVTAFIPGPKSLAVNPPSCGTGPSVILSAQAVPSAAMLPCITAVPAGWQVGGANITSGPARFWLDSDQAGEQALTVTLSAACDTSGAQQIPSDQPGARRFERPLSLYPQFMHLRFYRFAGGCVTYRFTFTPGASPRWPSRPAARSRSPPGQRWSSTSRTPRAWRYAGRARHARDEPARRTNGRQATASCRPAVRSSIPSRASRDRRHENARLHRPLLRPTACQRIITTTP